MPKKQKPYNIEYCQAVDCSKRSGNKCTVEKCVRNFKRIKYWEQTGEILPEDVEDA